MATTSINLHGVTATQPSVQIIESNRGSFLSVQFGDDAAVLLPGFDSECAAYARTLALALFDAIGEMKVKPTPVALVHPDDPKAA